MTRFEIDFKNQNVRARIPNGAVVTGNASFQCGVLLEGEFDGGILHTEGLALVMETGKLSGFAEIAGDLYILGTVEAQKIEVNGVVHIGSSAKVSGYIVGADFKLYAGCSVTAALNKRSS